jgi:hypothetical protein
MCTLHSTTGINVVQGLKSNKCAHGGFILHHNAISYSVIHIGGFKSLHFKCEIDTSDNTIFHVQNEEFDNARGI